MFHLFHARDYIIQIYVIYGQATVRSRRRGHHLIPAPGPAAAVIKTVDHVQSVAGNPGHSGDPTLHFGLHLPIDPIEPVKARILIRQCRTDPGLGIAELPPERGLLQVLQLP